jgi:hypothetical protein
MSVHAEVPVNSSSDQRPIDAGSSCSKLAIHGVLTLRVDCRRGGTGAVVCVDAGGLRSYTRTHDAQVKLRS